MRASDMSPESAGARRLLWYLFVCGAGLLAAFVFTPAAQAHITVAPTHSTRGAAEQYTVTVPSERPLSTVKVRIEIPAGLLVYAFGSAPGWKREITTDAQGNVTTIAWSGGTILPEEYGQFSFMGRNPAQGTQLVWKATQTYQDGFSVAWTGPAASQQPASITSLGIGSAATDSGGGDAGSGGGGSSTTTEVALAVALLALALSLFGNGFLLLVLRRRLL